MKSVGKELVGRLTDEVFNGRKMEVLDDLMADDFVENAVAPFGSQAPGRVKGPDHMRGVVQWLVEQFPDLHFDILSVVAEDDLVAVRLHAEGTNLGRLNGVIPPTGKRFATQQTHWYRVVDGRLAEHWANRDDLAAMLQLGVIPRPGPPPGVDVPAP